MSTPKRIRQKAWQVLKSSTLQRPDGTKECEELLLFVSPFRHQDPIMPFIRRRILLKMAMIVRGEGKKI